MKVSAILLFRVRSATAQPVLLASTYDLSHLSFFQKGPAKEVIVFACRTIAMRTENGVRHGVKEGDYKIFAFNSGDLCALMCTDEEYPQRSAFETIRKVIDEYDSFSGGQWRSATEDSKAPVPCVDECLKLSQDPVNMDKLSKVKSQIQETRDIALTTMKSLLDRGEKLEDLAAQSGDLSDASKMFLTRSKELNKCCTIL